MGKFGRRSANDQAVMAWWCSASVAALTLACALVASSGAHAESIRDALTAAYQTNPRLDAERARLRATDEEVGRAESGYRPTVDGSADIGRQDSHSSPATSTSGETNPWGYSISIRQSVFNGFRTTNDVAEAKAGVKAGRENLRQVETIVLLEAATAYMDVIRDMESSGFAITTSPFYRPMSKPRKRAAQSRKSPRPTLRKRRRAARVRFLPPILRAPISRHRVPNTSGSSAMRRPALACRQYA